MNLKVLFTCSLLVLVVPFTCLFAAGPEEAGRDRLDEIIAAHIQARGGARNWAAVESMRVSGQFTHFSVQHPFLTLLQRPGKFYSEFHIGHQFVKEGFDGEAGWTIDPWQGFEFPRRVNRAEQHVFDQKAEFATPFFNYRERGHQVTLVGEDELDGMDMVVLQVVRPGGPPETWYLDAETFLEYKTITQWIDFATPVQAESYYDDFREVDGLVIPFFVERMFTNRHLVTQLEEVTINADIDPAVFTAPPCRGMLKASDLLGDWKVRVETQNRLGAWAVIDSTTTSFNFMHRDVMHARIFYGGAFPATHILNLTFHRRDGRYQMSVLNDFFSTTEVFEGDFQDNILILENVNSTQGTQRVPLQYRIHLGDSGYVLMERLRSADQGETWTVFEKIHLDRAG